MSKIDVTLTAVLHTDKGVLQPGETASMEEKQAKKLAALGMVKLPESRKNGDAKRIGPKAVKKTAAKAEKEPKKALEKDPEGETSKGDAGQTASENSAQEQA
jgi:hypothetical protein